MGAGAGYPSATDFGTAIDLSEQATMAADQVVGRKNGAGTGVPQAMSVAETLTLLGGGSAATGTGAVVLATSPTLVTPALGTPTSGSLAACTGGKQVVEAHTGDDTLTAAESGSCHTNAGAGGTVILTLPAATGSGVWFDFIVLATQTLTLEPNDADDVIYLNASVTTANTGTLSTGTIGRAVRIVDAGANKWVGISQVGAWTAT